MRSDGGYDDIYRNTSRSLWGTKPGSFVKRLLYEELTNSENLQVLDLGCGDGRNAAAFSRHTHKVLAADISPIAIRRAEKNWPEEPITWLVADSRKLIFRPVTFDVIVAYGVLHCLRNRIELEKQINSMKLWTKAGGYNVVCMFNDRDQDLSGHPGFNPLLVPHQYVLELYSDWVLLHQSDQTLYESHPNNNIRHHHSLTRLIAKKV